VPNVQFDRFCNQKFVNNVCKLLQLLQQTNKRLLDFVSQMLD